MSPNDFPFDKNPDYYPEDVKRIWKDKEAYMFELLDGFIQWYSEGRWFTAYRPEDEMTKNIMERPTVYEWEEVENKELQVCNCCNPETRSWYFNRERSFISNPRKKRAILAE